MLCELAGLYTEALVWFSLFLETPGQVVAVLAAVEALEDRDPEGLRAGLLLAVVGGLTLLWSDGFVGAGTAGAGAGPRGRCFLHEVRERWQEAKGESRESRDHAKRRQSEPVRDHQPCCHLTTPAAVR